MLNNVIPIFGTGAVVGDFDSIATVTVGAGGSSSITFSSIPQTYKHLQIRCIMQCASTDTYSLLRFNSDTGTNYANHYLDGNGTSAVAGASASASNAYLGYITTSSQTNIFGVAVVDILDYANTNKYKTLRTLNGKDANGSGLVELASSLWMNTNAITSINIITNNIQNFAQYSHFALYGVK